MRNFGDHRRPRSPANTAQGPAGKPPCPQSSIRPRSCHVVSRKFHLVSRIRAGLDTGARNQASLQGLRHPSCLFPPVSPSRVGHDTITHGRRFPCICFLGRRVGPLASARPAACPTHIHACAGSPRDLMFPPIARLITPGCTEQPGKGRDLTQDRAKRWLAKRRTV
jgi:hypothetical protein